MIYSAPAGVKAPARTEHSPFRQIPFAFRADPVDLDGLKLDPTARAAFVLILDNAKSRGWRSRLSNPTLGRVLGRCPMTISRALGRLESAGLIQRELIAGGRIRTGIVVTWEGVRREGLTGQTSLRREDLTGPTPAPKGVRREHLTNQSSPQSGDQTGPILLSGEEHGEIPDPATAAAYLRAMIEANRPKGGRPAPPIAGKPQDATPHAPVLSPVPEAASPKAGRPAPSPAAIPKPVQARPAQSIESRRPSPPAGPRLDDPKREVGRMLDQLAAGFIPPRGERRRLSPAELQRQLAEVRRKYGNRSVPGGG